uniref:Uncharacterized protein n=1 Tax=Podoviridae sp. ctUYJ6 TaxID=2827737 RepID=A0A8S5SCG5_9CAUD|nr:MAG TPA: hypothetical protein [Podoviridae sp. ctUYJ6]DAT26905.1 MAG TPA: hypothetical protein [Caudoviricetes sp.]
MVFLLRRRNEGGEKHGLQRKRRKERQRKIGRR